MAIMTISIYVSIMHNQLFMPPAPADSGQLIIKKGWEVHADLSYNNQWSGNYPHDGFILVRTLSGRGWLELTNGKVLDCHAGTVACVRPSSILSYGCREELWRFWWIECAEESSCNLEKDSIAEAQPLVGESDSLIESFRMLESGGATASIAAAALSLLVRKWEMHVGEKAEIHSREGVIIDLLTVMRGTMSKPLRIAKLAKRAHLSESRFRQVFTQAVGMPPKAYYEHLRIAKAAEWLRKSDMKLDEIAERLGYSNPFHLSKAFKRHHGIPPSEFRPRHNTMRSKR